MIFLLFISKMSLCNEAAPLKIRIWNSSSKRVMKLFFSYLQLGKRGLFLCCIYVIFTSDRSSLSPFFFLYLQIFMGKRDFFGNFAIFSSMAFFFSKKRSRTPSASLLLFWKGFLSEWSWELSPIHQHHSQLWFWPLRDCSSAWWQPTWYHRPFLEAACFSTTWLECQLWPVTHLEGNLEG